jgi:hypothetical protein
MKIAFVAGTLIQHKRTGGQAVITDFLKTWDWRIPGYLGDGFYSVRTLGFKQAVIVHEDDFRLADSAALADIPVRS